MSKQWQWKSKLTLQSCPRFDVLLLFIDLLYATVYVDKSKCTTAEYRSELRYPDKSSLFILTVFDQSNVVEGSVCYTKGQSTVSTFYQCPIWNDRFLAWNLKSDLIFKTPVVNNCVFLRNTWNLFFALFLYHVGNQLLMGTNENIKDELVGESTAKVDDSMEAKPIPNENTVKLKQLMRQLSDSPAIMTGNSSSLAKRYTTILSVVALYW